MDLSLQLRAIGLRFVQFAGGIMADKKPHKETKHAPKKSLKEKRKEKKEKQDAK